MRCSCALMVVITAFIAQPIVSQEISEQFIAGEHFQLLPYTQARASNQIIVAEVFRYDCVHCYTFEPHLESWKSETPTYVTLVRIPAAFNPMQTLHARAHYTAKALGKLDEMHAAFFREIHEAGNPLESETKLARFFLRFGVDQKTFSDSFNSFSVDTEVRRAAELIRRYRITGTPSIVVNERYLTTGGMAGSIGEWFSIVDFLAASERRSRSALGKN